MGWMRGLALCCGLLAAADQARAQNALADGDFDDPALASWFVNTGDWVWNSEDADGDPSSGSARGTMLSAFGAAISQCVAVTPDRLYLVGGRVRKVTGVPLPGIVGLGYYPDADCGGASLGEFSIGGTVGTSWTSLGGVLRTPPGAVSAIYLLGIQGTGDTDVVAIDDAVLSPSLFEEGFESGDLSGWSSSFP